jgi:hypothetical protein
LAALRAVPCFANCTFRLIIEANLGDQAQYISYRALSRLSDVEVVCSHQHCYGIFTTPGITEKYVFRLREKLHERAVAYHHVLVCANPYQQNLSREERVAAVKQKFERQMMQFRMVFNVPQSILSKIGITYTGKAGKDNERVTNAQDDLCMALLFGFYFCTMLTLDEPRAFVRSFQNALTYQQNMH